MSTYWASQSAAWRWRAHDNAKRRAREEAALAVRGDYPLPAWARPHLSPGERDQCEADRIAARHRRQCEAREATAHREALGRALDAVRAGGEANPSDTALLHSSDLLALDDERRWASLSDVDAETDGEADA